MHSNLTHQNSHSMPKKLWRFPSVLFKYPDGLVACACWNTHTILGWKRSHYLTIITPSIIIFAILLPYITAIAKKEMPAFLPFISQAAGHPPMNGMFAVPLITAAFFGFVTITLLYESINHRNINDSIKIRILNYLSTTLIFISLLGFIVTTAFPVGYTEVPNKFEWLITVLLEHSTGASMVLFGAPIFHFLMTAIWYYLPDATKRMKYLRMAISVGIIFLFLLTVKPMPDYIREELGPRGFDIEYLKNITYRLPLEFNTNYIICAFSEWAVSFFAIVNFLMLYGDLKRISFHVVIRHKSCFMDTIEPAPSITLKC